VRLNYLFYIWQRAITCQKSKKKNVKIILKVQKKQLWRRFFQIIVWKIWKICKNLHFNIFLPDFEQVNAYWARNPHDDILAGIYVFKVSKTDVEMTSKVLKKRLIIFQCWVWPLAEKLSFTIVFSGLLISFQYLFFWLWTYNCQLRRINTRSHW